MPRACCKPSSPIAATVQIIEFTADSLRFVEDLPQQAPSDGFVWIFLDRSDFPQHQERVQAAAQKLGGSALLEGTGDCPGLGLDRVLLARVPPPHGVPVADGHGRPPVCGQLLHYRAHKEVLQIDQIGGDLDDRPPPRARSMPQHGL